MHGGQDTAIEAALEVLYQHNAGAYEILVEQAETLSESLTLQKEGADHDVLLVVAPVVAWTRFSIPYGPIRLGLLDALKAQLHGHILAADVRLAMAPELYSVDQMPRSFSATRLWLNRLGAQALGLTLPRMPATDSATEVANLLADTRYVVAAVAVPRGLRYFAGRRTLASPSTRAKAAWRNGRPRPRRCSPTCCRAAASNACCPMPITSTTARPTGACGRCRYARRSPGWKPR